MITVGDQIFRLTQEVRKLKKQCERYEAALRDIAAGNGYTKSGAKPTSVAREALTKALPVEAAAN